MERNTYSDTDYQNMSAKNGDGTVITLHEGMIDLLAKSETE